VLPRTHTNCTNEIPAILNGTNVFVNPISFVIKAPAAPVRCNDVTREVEIEWPMVLRIPGDQGLCQAGEDPHEAHRHR
jgi:hypothetical protein